MCKELKLYPSVVLLLLGLATAAIANANAVSPFIPDITEKSATIQQLQETSTTANQSTDSIKQATTDHRGCGLRCSSRWVEVDDDGLDCPAAAFDTIQEAVNDPKATHIRVCAGVYPEFVTIESMNNVKILKGDGEGQTFVTGVVGGPGPIIDVKSGGYVKIKHLTVDGEAAMEGEELYGIRYQNTSGKIKHVGVMNIRDASGASQGVGIHVETTETNGITAIASSPNIARVIIENSYVQGYTRVGINGDGEGVHLTVFGNEIIGPKTPTEWAPNGIQISRGAEGRVAFNFIENNISPRPSRGQGSGIILFCPGRQTRVIGNYSYKDDNGIVLADAMDATVFRNIVDEAKFNAVNMQFLGLFFGDIGCTSSVDNIKPTERNTVSFNTLINSNGNGIIFVNGDSATDPDQPRDNKVFFNKVENSNDDGIDLSSGIANLLIFNSIENSGDDDAVDRTMGSGTAGTANIWLSNQCDDTDPSGLCF